MGGRIVENREGGKGQVRATCWQLTAMAGCLQVLPPWFTVLIYRDFHNGDDFSSPEVTARLLVGLRFWIQSWEKICTGLGLADSVAQLVLWKTHTGSCWKNFRMPSSRLLSSKKTCLRQESKLHRFWVLLLSFFQSTNWFKQNGDLS